MPIVKVLVHRDAVMYASDSSEALLEFMSWIFNHFPNARQYTETHSTPEAYVFYIYEDPMEDRTLRVSEVVGVSQGCFLVTGVSDAPMPESSNITPRKCLGLMK